MTAGPAHIYEGVVAHRRLRPVGHAFSYRVFSMLIDIDRIDEASSKLSIFSHNRFNLFSFHDVDHAFDGDAPLPAQIRATLWGAGFRGDGQILLLCYPRILGYVFNPLSVFYCYNAAGALEAVLYEVRNTFGDRHCYLIAAEEGGRRIRHSADKELYVSPFMDMDQRYEFDLDLPAEKLSIGIRQFDADGLLFTASFAGERSELTDRSLVAAFVRYPLMTLKVIAAIHWEAARLFAKGMRLRKRPPAPGRAVTIIPRMKAPRKAA